MARLMVVGCGGGGYKLGIGRLELCVMQSLCECWFLIAN